MLQVLQNSSGQVITATLPALAINVQVGTFYENTDPITPLATATPVSGNNYSYTLNPTDTSCWGNAAVIWQYNLTGDVVNVSTGLLPTYKVYGPYNVYITYLSQTEFFGDYPTLESQNSDTFAMAERRMRYTVEQYCQQVFGFRPGRTINFGGSNANYLELPFKLLNLINAIKDYDPTNNITANIMVSAESPYFLTKKVISIGAQKSEDYERFFNEFEELDTGRYFNTKHTYQITGDWGWLAVPPQVNEAMRILVADFFNQDSDLRRHQITKFTAGGRVGVLTESNTDFYGTTGNVDADILLQEYTRNAWSHIF